MHHLYDGNSGYSQEASLVERVHPALWRITQDRALQFLKDNTYEESAVDALQRLPFELWRAENGFGDSFSVLYMKLPIADFVRIARESESESGARKYAAIAQAFRDRGQKLRFISMDYIESSGEDVDTPQLKSTSVAVEMALENLTTLLQHSDRGAASGVDRIHTALHAHLMYLCLQAGETPKEDADMGALFGLLRKHHPNPSEQSNSILRGLARVLDALSPLRNDHSLAHPSEALLDEPEATLALNAGRTILRYLDSRFSHS